MVAEAGRLGISANELRLAVDHELNGRKE